MRKNNYNQPLWCPRGLKGLFYQAKGLGFPFADYAKGWSEDSRVGVVTWPLRVCITGLRHEPLLSMLDILLKFCFLDLSCSWRTSSGDAYCVRLGKITTWHISVLHFVRLRIWDEIRLTEQMIKIGNASRFKTRSNCFWDIPQSFLGVRILAEPFCGPLPLEKQIQKR